MTQLEDEAIEIIREAVAGARNPVMMYSIGKDSSVMLHLARKAFHPGRPPFPLLHVDTTWKFRDMYAHRERMAAESGMKLIVEDPLRVVQQAPEQRRFAVVHAAAGDEAQRRFAALPLEVSDDVVAADRRGQK